MKRKYFSVLLMAAMTMASTSMVTSCKDYDDDINSVQTQVDAANDLIKKLTEQATTLQTAVSTAQSTADAAKTAAAEAASAAKAAQETGNEALAQAKTAEANAQAAKAAAAEAQKAAIEEATKQVNALKDEVQAALNNKVDVATFNDTVAKLEGEIAGIDNNLNKLGDDVKQNQADIKTAKEAIATLEAAKKDAALQIAALEAYKTTLENSTIPGLNEAIKANGVEIGNNKQSIEKLKNAIKDAQEELSNSIVGVASDLTALEATVKGIDDAYKKADADLKKEIQDLLDDAKTNHDKDVSAINGKIDDINKLIADNKDELKKYTDDEVEKVKDDLQTQINQLAKLNIDGTEKGLTELFKEVNQKFDNYYTTGQIDQKIADLTTNYTNAINTAISTAKDDIAKAQKKITDVLAKDINILHILVAQRLSSLVFAPTTYIDGVEAIKFASLEYYDWGEDLERDAPAKEEDENHVIIKDKETIAKYLLNPSGVSLDDVDGFEFIANNATNILTRASEAPLNVTKSEIANGFLNLNVQKTGNASFGTSNTNFTIVSLKAKLADKVLTESEKKDGKPVYVYSDWARLYETSTRPYIHNVLATTSDGKANELSYATPSHFWKYSEVYNGKTKATELPWSFNDKHVVKSVPYTESVDLLKLVEVCDHNQTLFDLNNYGLSFEFNLIDYKLKNENATVDATNQKDFAKIVDGHILKATSRNGKEDNRDAVGRQPMIQVVLKEGDKVVDVRYFKIKWTAEQNVQDYGDLVQGEEIKKPYRCGDVAEYTINEKYVNSLYEYANLTRDEFHNSYLLNTQLWTSKELAAEASSSKALQSASIIDLEDWQDAGQTHNMKYTFSFGENFFKPTQAEYEAGVAERTVYGCFVKKTNMMDKIVFSLKVTIPIDKMAYADGINYSQEQWTPAGLTIGNGLTNNDKNRTINPSLRSDAKYGTAVGYKDAQLVGDLKAGYMKNGQVPASIAALVKNAQTVTLTFDENRLEEVASETNTKKADWTLSTDRLTLKYKNTAAATISAEGYIQLAETNPGMHGVPTEGALLLVGKSVPVVLASDYCSLTQTIDKYLVSFITPLEMNIDAITENLKDIIDGGSSSVSIVGKVHVREAFGLKRTVLGPNKKDESTSDALKAELKSWYIVSDANWDTSNAVTNLTKDGSISSSTNHSSWTKLSDLKGADGKVKYTLKHNATAGTVTFHNMSGNAIAQSFKVAIPVKVTTKWGNFTKYVEITVEKGF